MGKRPKERPAIVQEEAVQTRIAMDFRGALPAVFRPRTQEAVVRGDERGGGRRKGRKRGRGRHVDEGTEDDSREDGTHGEEGQGEG